MKIKHKIIDNFFFTFLFIYFEKEENNVNSKKKILNKIKMKIKF